MTSPRREEASGESRYSARAGILSATKNEKVRDTREVSQYRPHCKSAVNTILNREKLSISTKIRKKTRMFTLHTTSTEYLKSWLEH